MTSVTTFLIAAYATIVVAHAQVAAPAAESSMDLDLGLNAATAQLKLAKPTSAGSVTGQSTFLVTMQMTLAAGCLAAIMATILSKDLLSQASYQKLCAQARALTSQGLFLVLSALSLSPQSSSLKSKAKPPPRTNFSLDIKLDPVHLSMDNRARRSLSNLGPDACSKMTPALLESPLIDMLALTPKQHAAPIRSARTRRSGSGSSRGCLSSYTTPRTPRAAPVPSPSRDPDGQPRRPDGAVDRGSEQPHPGRKPSLRKMQDAKEAQELLRLKQREEARAEEDGWSDDDWECEPRAPVPETGLEMDGEDVGCLPSRVLKLPKPMVASGWGACNPYGRSMLQADWPIPRA